VKPDSDVETFAALRLGINSWRWKGVPFYIRAGKQLPVTATEVFVKLRQPPMVYPEMMPPANYFRFRVTPTLVIAVGAFVKVAGRRFQGEPVELVVSEQVDPREVGAYEELLWDAMHKQTARFARQDYVEEAWRIVDPVLGDLTPVHEYAPGTWGPVEAAGLASADGGWLNPK
jgi:glucose-6-phosphate 1-dehydrogenase